MLTSVSATHDTRAHRESSEVLPVPCIRLTCEHLLVETGATTEDICAPVIELSFDYAGVAIAADDPRERVFLSQGTGLVPVDRHQMQERNARYLLESFGAVELRCLDSHEPGYGSKATYLVQLEDNVHGYCAFSSHALPQLERQGFRVEVDANYPYQTLSQEPVWYGNLRPGGAMPSAAAPSTGLASGGDWFELELGVEVDGVRVNLLAALLEIVNSAPKAASLQRLLQSTRAIALPVGENRFLSVPRDSIALILDVLRDLYAGAERQAAGLAEAGLLRREQCVDLARLQQACSSRHAPRGFDHPVVRLGEQLLAAPEPTARPVTLRAELRGYQAAGLSWLQRLREADLNGLLADDMGLGKTLQTIAHIVCEKDAGRLQTPALVVAPTSLVGNWTREIAKFAPGLKVSAVHGPKRRASLDAMSERDVIVTTYPVLVKDLKRFVEQPFHLVILDEAQAIKNPRSQTHRAVAALQCNHRVCLTGTPIENNLGELWALFDFLMPGFLGNAESFRSQFRVPIEQEGDLDRLAALRTRTAPFILRRMKDRVATELPAKTELLLPVELSQEERDLYESIRVAAHADVRSAIRKRGLQGSTVTILDALMKLRQVCCDPRLVPVPAAERIKRSSKYDALLQLIERQLEQGHRLLVFSQFTSMLSLITEGARERGIEPLVLTGASRERQRLIERFEEGESNLFLISLKAGGAGLNLTCADSVVHYDPWWNPAVHAQATGRAHRIGQTKPVFVHNLIVAGSVEERMLDLQRGKQELAASMLGQEPSGSLSLSEEQVHELFAPLQPQD